MSRFIESRIFEAAGRHGASVMDGRLAPSIRTPP